MHFSAIIKLQFWEKRHALLCILLFFFPREARTEGPSVARLINLSGRAEGPSGAKPRQFERKIYLLVKYIYLFVENVRNVA